MKLFIVITLLSSIAADEYCTGIYFNDKYYNVDIIKEGINHIRQIAYSPSDNTIYFTFEQLSIIPERQLGYIRLETRKVGVVDGIRNATGLAVDRLKNRIYVGGSEGLYFINQVNKVPERLPVAENIRHLFFKDVLYIVNHRKEVLQFSNGVTSPLLELRGVTVDSLVADDDNNLLFLDQNHLYRVKLGTRAVNHHDGYAVTALGTDKYYRPYICSTKGVYIYNKYKYALDKVSDKLTGLKALTFNTNDEPIYSFSGHIVKLNYNPIPCLGD